MPFANLDSTAARIAKMLPPARAQFAQMHKADPIMMSLVSFVDNQEKAFLSANLARQAGTEPPKVNDQIIASINPQAPQGGQGMPQGAPQQPQAAQQLPENTGIAALPAPNMQQMADGGITGYQDDLYVPDDSDARMGNGGYNFPQGESVIRMANGTPPEMFYSPEESLSTYTQAEPTSREEQIYKEAEAYRQRFKPKISKERELEDKQLAEFDAATQMFERDNKQKAAPKSPQAESRLMPQRTMAAPSAGQGPEAVYKRMTSEPTVDPYAEARQGISDFAISAAEKRREQLAKDIAERGEAFKGAEDRAKNAMLAGLEQAGAKRDDVAKLFTQIAAAKEAAQIKAAGDAANSMSGGIPGLVREISAASPEKRTQMLDILAKAQGHESKAQTAHEKLLASDTTYKMLNMQFATANDEKERKAIQSKIVNYLSSRKDMENLVSGKNPQNAFPGFSGTTIKQ